MSPFETTQPAMVHPLIKPASHREASRLRIRLAELWPAALIALGGLMTLAWGGLLLWGGVQLVLWAI